jgi:LytS/YehU family sensor histidine kinase
LEVEAYDGSEWYPLPSSVRIKIEHPWWRQWWFTTIVVLIIVGSLLAFYRAKLNSYRKELLIARQISDLESRALRAQMNPHFVFNCLNAIQECVVTGRIDEAYTYLSKFSRLLRLVLEHSDLTETSLQQELEILDLYVSLEKLRFKEPIDYRLDISDEIETEQIHIPPMLIQPHIENAIWHGLRHSEKDKKLTIYIKEIATEYLDVIIEDNGVGRERAMELKSSRLGASQRHTSKGLAICTQRIELLQNQYPQTRMEFEDLYNKQGVATGTRVTVVLPIILQNKGGMAEGRLPAGQAGKGGKA